jgi:hypothetical protein
VRQAISPQRKSSKHNVSLYISSLYVHALVLKEAAASHMVRRHRKRLTGQGCYSNASVLASSGLKAPLIRSISARPTSSARALRVTPAMAAGMTDRLWEVSDIVALWEAIEPKAGKRGPYKRNKFQTDPLPVV